jgi:peptidoglycan/xylan/chitin deacetylase (PgdA/CDA1 family)
VAAATKLPVTTLALAYHSVSPSWSHELAVPPHVFRAQMHALARRGFVGVRFAELANRPRHRAVAITFDDGFRTVLEHAKPVLDELGWPATVFVVTAAPRTTEEVAWLAADADTGARAALGWADIERLHDAGWEIGSHTRSHRLLSALPADVRDDELARSREEIAARVGACESISYPWGEVDDAVVSAARRAGYVAGSGLAGRFSRRDPMRVPRFAVGRSDRPLRFRLKTSPAVGWVRGTPAWTVVEGFRRPGVPLGVVPRIEEQPDG